jgi:hypothetical protein
VAAIPAWQEGLHCAARAAWIGLGGLFDQLIHFIFHFIRDIPNLKQ